MSRIDKHVETNRLLVAYGWGRGMARSWGYNERVQGFVGSDENT